MVFLSFPTRGIAHFITYTQNTTERVVEKEQTNKHGLGSAPSTRKGVCDTLHSPCICRLSQACILRETSLKATRNANSSLTVFPHCLLLLTVLPLDCYLTPTGLFCPPLSTALSVFSGTFLPSSTSGLARDLAYSPMCGFRAKTDKEIVWVASTQMKRIATHCLTTLCLSVFVPDPTSRCLSRQWKEEFWPQQTSLIVPNLLPCIVNQLISFFFF